MDFKDVQRAERPEKRSKNITIKAKPSDCKWMKENKVSPTLLFNKALEELKKKVKK